MEIGGVDWALNSWIGSTETESIIVIVIVVVICNIFIFFTFIVIFYTSLLENVYNLRRSQIIPD